MDKVKAKWEIKVASASLGAFDYYKYPTVPLWSYRTSTSTTVTMVRRQHKDFEDLRLEHYLYDVVKPRRFLTGSRGFGTSRHDIKYPNWAAQRRNPGVLERAVPNELTKTLRVREDPVDYLAGSTVWCESLVERFGPLPWGRINGLEQFTSQGFDNMHALLYEMNVLNEFSLVVTSAFGGLHSFTRCPNRRFGGRFCRQELRRQLFLDGNGCTACDRYSMWVEGHLTSKELCIKMLFTRLLNLVPVNRSTQIELAKHDYLTPAKLLRLSDAELDRTLLDWWSRPQANDPSKTRCRKRTFFSITTNERVGQENVTERFVRRLLMCINGLRLGNDSDAETVADGFTQKAYFEGRRNDRSRVQVKKPERVFVGDSMHLRTFNLGGLKLRELYLMLGILGEGLYSLGTRVPEKVQKTRVQAFPDEPGFSSDQYGKEWGAYVAQRLPEAGRDSMCHVAHELLELNDGYETVDDAHDE